MKQLVSTAFLLLTTFVFTLSAQTPTPTPTPIEEDDVVVISSNLIQIDATVTDQKGRLVPDLKAEDFEIYENAKKQEITTFTFVSTTQPATATENKENNALKNAGVPTPPARLRPEQVRRTISLVVDDLGLSFESTAFVRRALKKFVDEQMQPGDLVAIIRTSSGIGALQQFTADKRLLNAAIERIRFNIGRAGISAFAPIESGNINDPRTAQNENQDQAERNNGETELNQLREDIFTVGTLGAVNYVVRGMRELPGRKAVILFSDGFRLFNRENQNDRVLTALRRLTDLANRASVVIYTLDARGLVVGGLTAADDVGGLSAEQVEERLSDRRQELFDTQEGLIYLARQTGGISIRNSNDINLGIEKILDDQKGYYLLGYQPESETFDPKKSRYNKLEAISKIVW